MADVTYRLYTEATLGGSMKTVEHSGTVAGATQVYDQVLPLTETKATVLTIASDEAGATLESWSFLLLENLSSTSGENINVAFTSTGDTEHFVIQIPPGRFFILWNPDFDADSSAVAGAIPDPASSINLVEAITEAGNPLLRIVAYDDTAVTA